MFRLKIALLSLVLSGTVLAGFGLYFLSIMNKAGLDRMDREILALGGSQLSAPAPLGHWHDFGKSLLFIYGEESSKELAVLIRSADTHVVFRSDHWPEGISEEAFPEFNGTLEPIPPFLGERMAPWNPAAPGFRRPFDRAPAFTQPSPGRFNKPGEGSIVPPPPPDPGERPGIPPIHIKKPFFQTIKTQEGSWRVGIMGNQYVTILIARSMTGFFKDADLFRKAFLSIAPLALLLLAGGGWVIAHRALKPVAMITRTAESITTHDLGQRVPAAASDRELARLVQVLNSMLDRLQKGFEQARRFSADAAHELQTPLTVLQGELDYAVQHAVLGSEEQRRYSALLEEAQRLKAIVQKLLVLARADAGKLNVQTARVDLSAMIESAVEDAGAMAPELRIEKDIAAGITVDADPDLLRQAVQNLTSNAVKYNREPGLIRFRLHARDGKAQFTIQNSGIRIPDEDRERIFDRFFRVDKARSRAVAGAGLGLSLAREIARAHNAELRLDPDKDGVVSFTFTMPLRREIPSRQ